MSRKNKQQVIRAQPSKISLSFSKKKEDRLSEENSASEIAKRSKKNWKRLGAQSSTFVA